MRRPTFRRFAAFTTTLTGLLVMLGVYTAATGSGLACAQQWPLCDGGVLPQSLPSFIEWFHRLVAMVTGFFIAGTAAWSWRGDDRWTQVAATAALVLLPLQISIGAVTVTLEGAIPRGYSPPTHAAHLLVALTIFSLLTLATLSAARDQFEAGPGECARNALLWAVPALVVTAAASRAVPLVAYDPAMQAVFVGGSLAVLATLLAALVWLGEADRPRPRALAGAALATHLVAVLLGRDLVLYTDGVRAVNQVLLAATVACVAGAAWLLSRGRGSGMSPATSTR